MTDHDIHDGHRERLREKFLAGGHFQPHELLELLLMENPVCNPITETNKDVPSFENVFIVLCAFAMISVFVSGIQRFIRKPTDIDANRIPAMPSEMCLMCILPMVNPKTIIKNRRLNGVKRVVKTAMIPHQAIAYEEDGYRDTSFESYRSVCRYDNDRRTIPHSQFSFQAHQARFRWSG